MAISLNEHGKLTLPPKTVRQLTGKKLELISDSPYHLLVAARGDVGELVLSGKLGEFSVTDLMSMLNLFRKTGILNFHLTGGEKAVYFQQGEVVFASSTFLDDDLGEVLFSLGKIDRATLEKARQFVTPKTTLGKILVEKKAVSPKDLWAALRRQVEDIVYNLFAFESGSYSFLSKPLDKEQIIRLSMGTQNLIMEGLRRTDERGMFMRAIGSLDNRVMLADEIPDELSAAEQTLVKTISGQELLVRDVLRTAGFGEFDGLRLLFQLKEKQLVSFEAIAEADLSGAAGEMVKIFNGALKVLHARISEKNHTFYDEVRRFLHDLPQPFSFVLRDVVLHRDGTLDGLRMLHNLSGLDEEDQKRLLVDAINELIYMECMVARRELDAEQSAPLLQRVQEISRRVKELVGREK